MSRRIFTDAKALRGRALVRGRDLVMDAGCPHPSPRHVMIVQVIGFAALSVKEGILAVFLTEAKVLRSRAVVRGRVIW